MQCVTSFWSMLFCWIMINHFKTAKTQRNGDFPLVTVPDLNVTFDTSVAKIFSTQIEVVYIQNFTFNESLFREAALNYYNGTLGTNLNGFLRLNIQTGTRTNRSVEVAYDVVYNYTALRNSVNNDEDIRQAIANITQIKQGLEAYAGFGDSFSVSLTPFTVTGNSLCSRLTSGCPQGAHAVCEEARIGVQVLCRSSCKTNNFVCLNNGLCQHNDGNTSPVCSCQSSFEAWYIGTHCDAFIHLWMPILFFVLVFLILIAIILLACCLPVKLKKKKEDKKHALHKQRIAKQSKSTDKKVVKPQIAPSGSESIRRQQPQVFSTNAARYSRPEVNDDDSANERNLPPVPNSSANRSESVNPPSNSDYESAYTQVLPHPDESGGWGHRSVENPDPSSENEEGTRYTSTSGEELASYMPTDISSNISGNEMRSQNEEAEQPSASYAQVQKNPRKPAPGNSHYMSEELNELTSGCALFENKPCFETLTL